jgi:hypothetical protein
MRLGSSIEAGRAVAANGTRGSLPPLDQTSVRIADDTPGTLQSTSGNRTCYSQVVAGPRSAGLPG